MTHPDDNDVPASLTPRARRAFDALRRHLDAPDKSLHWHHRCGRLVRALFAADRNRSRGRLARALGISWSSAGHHARLAVDYDRAAVARLQRLGMTWGPLRLLSAVPDKADRDRLVETAARERWTESRV